MVENNKFDDRKSEGGTPFKKKNPTTHFSSNILKMTVGPDKALLAFQSISTGAIPSMQAKKQLELEELQKTVSQGLIGKSFLGENLGFNMERV